MRALRLHRMPLSGTRAEHGNIVAIDLIDAAFAEGDVFKRTKVEFSHIL